MATINRPKTRRDPAAGAYAHALFEVGQARGESEAYAGQLEGMVEAFLGAPELRIFLESPKVPREAKKAAFERALAGKASEPVLNLVRVLIDRGRQRLFWTITEIYGELLDEALVRVPVTITAARPYPDALREKLIGLLRARTGREVIPVERIDPALLGGITIKIGDTFIDGSLRTKLKVVRDAMAAPRLGRNLLG
jgi:F-type H+-transporting ATPase subunit delta